MKSTELGQMCHDYALTLSNNSFPELFGPMVEKVAEDCRRKILDSAGKYEVDANTQSFETTTVGTMAVGLREELLDVINYCVMIRHLAEHHDASYNEKVLRAYCDTAARTAMSSLLLIQGRLDNMVRVGEFTPNPGKDYVEQLSVDSGVDHTYG